MGIVRKDSSVVTATPRAASSVSAPDISAKIVVVTIAGRLICMVSTSEGKAGRPIHAVIPSIASGDTRYRPTSAHDIPLSNFLIREIPVR